MSVEVKTNTKIYFAYPANVATKYSKLLNFIYNGYKRKLRKVEILK